MSKSRILKVLSSPEEEEQQQQQEQEQEQEEEEEQHGALLEPVFATRDAAKKSRKVTSLIQKVEVLDKLG